MVVPQQACLCPKRKAAVQPSQAGEPGEERVPLNDKEVIPTCSLFGRSSSPDLEEEYLDLRFDLIRVA